MAETPEAGAKKLVRAVLEQYEVYYQMPTTAGYGRSGSLDFTACAWGNFVAIEVKSIHSKYGKNGPTALQWKAIDAVLKSGGIAMSVNEATVGDLHRVLTCLLHKQPSQARIVATDSLHRHTRPTLTPDTDTQPTKRKKP